MGCAADYLERDVAELRRQLDASRDECVQLKRDLQRQTALLSSTTQERDSANEQVNALKMDVKELRELRATVEDLQPVRSQLATVKSSLDASDIAVTQERTARRSAEAEVEQLHLRVRGVEADAQQLTTELHRAQCDAAERASLADDVATTTWSRSCSTSVPTSNARTRLQEELERSRGAYDALVFGVKTMARKVVDCLGENDTEVTKEVTTTTARGGRACTTAAPTGVRDDGVFNRRRKRRAT